jgi:hypothetical protein
MARRLADAETILVIPASAGQFYSNVKDPWRGERLIGEEPRAQTSVRNWDQGRLIYRRFVMSKGADWLLAAGAPFRATKEPLTQVYRTEKSTLAVHFLFSWRCSL